MEGSKQATIPGPRWTAAVVGLALFAASAAGARAQTPPPDPVGRTEVGVSVLALASLQPVEDLYIGSPYLNEGLGGWALGGAVGVNVVARRHFVFAAEFSTCTGFEVQQKGRLVNGEPTGRLRDTLFTFLAGLAKPLSSDSSIQFLGGLSRMFGAPTLDGVPVDDPNDLGHDPAVREGAGRFALTFGVDVSGVIDPLASVVVSFRYSSLPRSRRAMEIGVGSDVYRVGVGIRFRLRR